MRVNGYYTIRPHDAGHPQHAFQWVSNTARSLHWFRWEPGRITFQSLRGHRPDSPRTADRVAEWVYTGSFVPPPGEETPRINLWLLNGQPPTNRREVEVIISRIVDDADLLLMLFNFGVTGACMMADLNQDGIIDDSDLLQVLFHFGSGC